MVQRYGRYTGTGSNVKGVILFVIQFLLSFPQILSVVAAILHGVAQTNFVVLTLNHFKV